MDHRMTRFPFLAVLLAGCAHSQPVPAPTPTPVPTPAPVLASGPANAITCGADPTFTQDSTVAIQACVKPGQPLYFPPGHYKITAPIFFQFAKGAMIYGSGRFTTTIENVAGTGVIKTDGFEYGEIKDLALYDDGKSAPVVDLDWPSNSTAALQSNTFANLYIQGGAVGVRIGASGNMGSENLFLNVFVSGSTHGYEVDNFNALQNTLIGGNIQSCDIGILVNSGTMSVYNTGFQENKTWDYQQINAANDAVVLSGSRSESLNFASIASGGEMVTVSGVSQTNPNPGTFLTLNGLAFVSGSRSLNGQVICNQCAGEITASSFGRADWLVSLHTGPAPFTVGSIVVK